MGMIWRVFKHLWNLRKSAAGAIPRRPDAPSARPWGLQFDSLAAIGAEQVQFIARGDRPDALADAGRHGPRNPHDHFARRQLAGVGGNGLCVALPGAVE